MKKLLFLIAITITITIHAAGQQHIVTYWDALKKSKHEVFDLNKNGEKNGKYTAYFLDGSINMESTYKNGKQDGKETLYYNDETGRGLAHVYNYVNDKQDGLQLGYIEPSLGEYYFKYVRTETFYKNGEMIWKKTYDMDKAKKRYLGKEELFRDGSFQAYLTKGYTETGHQCYQIAIDGFNWQEATPNSNRIEFYTKNGKKDSLYREWYPNGQIGDSCYYKDGILEGVEKRYSQNGRLIMDVVYLGGTMLSPIDSSKTSYDSSGHFKMYSKQGLLMIEGTIIGEKLQGECKIYFDGVRILKICFYKDGKLNGHCKTWVLNDDPKKDKPYELKSDLNYTDGMLDGECVMSFANWKLPWSSNPEEAKPIFGENSIKELYDHGKLIKRWMCMGDGDRGWHEVGIE